MRSKRKPSESDPIRDAAPGSSKLRGPMLPLRHFRAMPKAVVGHGFRFQAPFRGARGGAVVVPVGWGPGEDKGEEWWAKILQSGWT